MSNFEIKEIKKSLIAGAAYLITQLDLENNADAKKLLQFYMVTVFAGLNIDLEEFKQIKDIKIGADEMQEVIDRLRERINVSELF